MTPFPPLLAGLLLALLAPLAAAQDPARGPLQVEQPWARPTVPGQRAGGAYFALRNTGPVADRLLGGRTPAAERVELHTMTMDGDVMRMREVEAIDVPARGRTELKPGGLHLMLMGLKAPLQSGDRVPLVLRFEKAGEVQVLLPVGPAPAAASAPAAHRHH